MSDAGPLLGFFIIIISVVLEVRVLADSKSSRKRQ